MEERLPHLLDAYLEGCLTDLEAGELRDMLRASPEARRVFWEYVEQHALIEDILGESRGRDLALLDGASPPGPPIAITSLPGREAPAAAGDRHLLLWAGALAALAAAILIALAPQLRRGGFLSEAPGPAALATVHSVAGDVQVTDLSGKSLAVTPGLELFGGQALRVGDEESQVEILFADGTLVVLGSGTNVRFPPAEAAQAKKLHLERGAIQVQPSPRSEDQELIVTTDQARVTARETRFRLYREEHASRMELAEGKARLESPAGDYWVDMAEGSFVVVTDDSQPMVTQPLPPGRCRLRHTFLKAGDAVCFSGDGARVVTHHFDRGWKAWSTVDGTLQAAAPGSRQRTTGLAYTSARDKVIALGTGGMASLWKIGEPRASQTRLRDQKLRGGAVSEDGRWLAQAGANGEVVVWEVDPQRGSISLRRSLGIKPSRVALSGSGPNVAVSRWGGEIHVFGVKTGREAARYKLGSTPTPLALSADGHFLAAYGNKDGLVLFDQRADTRQTLWAGQGARVSHLHFSVAGRVLLAGLEDGTVRAWSTEDGQPLLVLETGHQHVLKVTVTADLSLLATVGDNDCVKIWECSLPGP